jgi:hypothetical protein
VIEHIEHKGPKAFRATSTFYLRPGANEMRWDCFARWSFDVAPRLTNLSLLRSSLEQQQQRPAFSRRGEHRFHGAARRRVERTDASSYAPNISSSAPRCFLTAMRYDKIKGRELFATCDVNPHTPLLRVTARAALQSIDVVQLIHSSSPPRHAAVNTTTTPHDICGEFDALCQSLVDDVLRTPTLMAALPRRMRVTAGRQDLHSTLYAHAESWLLAFCAAKEFDRGPSSLHYGYLHGCLPRQPLPVSAAGWRRLGERNVNQLRDFYGNDMQAATMADINAARSMDHEKVVHHFVADATEAMLWKQVMARHVLSRCDHDGAVDVNGEEGEEKEAGTNPTINRLVWAFDCVRSRAHPFSFHSKENIFSPRRYPLSPTTTVSTQEHPGMCSLTLCPWFDMINDGPVTNVDFVDAPSSASPSVVVEFDASPARGHESAASSLLKWKNRDIVIEAGPSGLRKGEALTMCYSATTTTAAAAAACGHLSPPNFTQRRVMDVPGTLLKFGFLPFECSSRTHQR